MKNFGFIKSSFNTVLCENISNKRANSDSSFKSYVKQLKENKSLKTQFLIYKNIEDKVEENESLAREFVKESIGFMDGFSKKEIKEAINSLIAINPDVLNVKDVYMGNDDLKLLHENISYLILTDRNPNTIGKIVETTNCIVNYIKNNKPSVVSEGFVMPNSQIGLFLVEKYNETYEDLDESYKTAIRIITESNESEQSEFFTESVSNCLELINSNLKDSEIGVKESLLAAKENLLNKKYEPKTFLTDISKILEFTEDLK